MKKLSKVLVISVAAVVSVIIGHILAEAFFSPNPNGDDVYLACDFLAGMTIYFLYKVIKKPFREAAAARLARYEARRNAKFREIEARIFMMRYEAFRRDLLEGRRGKEC